jgi:hypothetical protein
MRARLVTGYVPIPGHPRTAQEYGELGEKLSGVPVRKKAFYSRVEDTWLAKFIASYHKTVRVSQGDNPAKNSAPYHCVNHQKSTWLVQAANEYPDDDWLVWVDYGVFSQPGISNRVIYEMFEKLTETPDNKIYAPGCLDRPQVVESPYPCWRFCGSVLAVPRRMVDQFDYECRVTARRHITTTQNLEFEVNTYARVEQRGKLPFHVYRADHNETLFTAFPDPGIQEGAVL